MRNKNCDIRQLKQIQKIIGWMTRLCHSKERKGGDLFTLLLFTTTVSMLSHLKLHAAQNIVYGIIIKAYGQNRK
jgi:hypothetical protein